jgi:tetratricopeptide (TPR) repeat protein
VRKESQLARLAILLLAAQLMVLTWPASSALADDAPTTEAHASTGSIEQGDIELQAIQHIEQARALAAEGDATAAEEQYRAALALSPSPALYIEIIGFVTGNAGREDSLAQLWGEFLAAFPEHPEALAANARRLYDSGNFAAAAEVFSRGAIVAPMDARFLRGEADSYFSLSDHAKAVPLYRQSLELEFSAVATANLATAQVASGDLAGAEDTWQRALILHPDDPELRMQYGLTLMGAGNYGAALAQFRQGQALAPGNDLFHNRAGLCLFQLGQASEALAEVEAALALRSNPLYYYNLATGYAELGNVENAARCFLEALEQYPDDVDLREAYAGFLIDQGNYVDALSQLRALAEQSGSADAFAKLAAAAANCGDREQASAAYLKALNLAPADASLHAGYAMLLAQLGLENDLLAQLASAHGVLDSNGYAQVVDAITGYWLDAGRLSQGTRLLEQIIAINPQSPAAYNALAMCHQQTGDVTSALIAVQRGLNDAGDNYTGRFLEAYFSYLEYGAAAALPLMPALVNHPSATTDAYEMYLELLVLVGDLPSQLAVAEQGLTRFPESVGLLGYLARALYSGNETEQLINLLTDRHYARLEWSPRDEYLGRCYLDTGNYVKATAHLTAASARTQNNAQLLATLGEAQFFMADLEEARRSLTHALALDEQLPEARLWLGMVLLAQGDLTGAEHGFSEVDKAATGDTAAWLALGRAKLALARNDLAAARQLLDNAAHLPIVLERFQAMLSEATSALDASVSSRH